MQKCSAEKRKRTCNAKRKQIANLWKKIDLVRIIPLESFASQISQIDKKITKAQQQKKFMILCVYETYNKSK